MKKIIWLLVVGCFGYLALSYGRPDFFAGLFRQNPIVASRMAVDVAVVKADSPAAIVAPHVTPLDLGSETFIQYPTTLSSESSIYTLSLGGSTHGQFFHHDGNGGLVSLFNHKGHGPGEFSEPVFFNMIGDEIFVSERSKLAVHVLDTKLNYKQRLDFNGIGYVMVANEDHLGIWGYRRHRLGSLAGHMLTLHDRKTGKAMRELVPVDTALFSLSLSGGAVWHRGKIYAVTANTGMIDIIDGVHYKTTRIDPHDGVYVFRPPQPWEKWSLKHTLGSREQRVRAWQATFPIPVDIGVVDEKLVVLYARSSQYFYNVHRLDGTLVSRQHQVPIPHPRLHRNRLEGTGTDENDRQYHAYIDLALGN